MKSIRTKKQINREAELSAEMDLVTIPWDEEMRTWHKKAMELLPRASVASLGVHSSQYRRLLQSSTEGLNMNIIAALANNIERRSPFELGISPEQYADLLELNNRVAARWTTFFEPIAKKVDARIELMFSGGGGHIIGKA